MSLLLTRLETAGLVLREKGTDKRSVTVDLTDRGRELRARLPRTRSVMRHLGMEMEDLAALHDRLLAFITAADRLPT